MAVEANPNLSLLTADEKRLTLQAVLDSETFARSDQLRRFLKYVGELAIEGRAREVTEYLIAVEALGRQPDFSPADDSSVRSRAHELRHKLQKYYESEGRHVALQIEIPKGSYIPKFVPRLEQVAPPPEPASAPASPRRPVALLVLAALAVAVIAVLSWMLWQQRSARPNPVIAQAWGPLAMPGGNVLVCIATPLHLVVRPYMSIVAEGLPKYPAPAELYPLFRQHRPLPPDTQLDMHPVDNSIQMGQMGALLALTGVFQGHGAAFQVFPERSAPVTVMRGRNVILIGDPQNSTAAAGFLEKTPFTIDYDPVVQDLVVRDRRNNRSYIPKRGPDNRYSDAFGLVTVVPSPGAKNKEHTVILSGITSVGSQAAAEFFASAHDLQALRKRFPGDTFPAAYQVVVRCKSNDTLLISEDYEVHAIIQ
jgi:hypothetical protein